MQDRMTKKEHWTASESVPTIGKLPTRHTT